MSNHSAIENKMSRPAIHKTIGAAIGTILALLAIATALIIAAVYPALNGRVIAVATGACVGAIALAVTLGAVARWRRHLPSNNDALVFW